MQVPDGWTAESVRANGVDLQTYRAGDGPLVVFAHGLFDGGLRWVPVAERLTDEYEVVTYDARGHGDSDAPESGYAIEDRVADLRAVIKAFGDGSGPSPVLVGHSMGAATVAWAVARDPDLARAVVLEDPVGLHAGPDDGPDPDERAAITRERLEGVRGMTVDEVVAEHYADEDPAQAERLARITLACSPNVAEIAREGYPAPLRETFSDLSVPTLVLRSDVDAERKRRDQAAAESLPDGRLVHVDGAGHRVFDDAPAAAHEELTAFLDRP